MSDQIMLTFYLFQKHLLRRGEAKLSHALRNIAHHHFLPITKGFSNKRQVTL